MKVGTFRLVALPETFAISGPCSPLRDYKTLEYNLQSRLNLTTMKILACSLIGVVSFASASAVFAADLEEGQITGTVVEFGDMLLTIEDSKKEQLTFNRGELRDQRYQPKVGDKVTMHYHTGRHGVVIKSQPKH